MISLNDRNGSECPLQCEDRCECNEGFFRHLNGNCFSVEDCLELRCSFNEVYTGTLQIQFVLE